MGVGCTKPKQQLNKYAAQNATMFEFKKIVGKGGFGKVWKVIQKKTHKTYAMKVMDKAKIITKKSVNSVLNEREILCQLQHRFIVNMHCSFQDRDNLYLLIDYLDGGDLRYYIHRDYAFNEQQIRFVVRCVMEGLKYLHDHNIIHRDIKPENIIFDKNGYAKVTDLGIARYWRSQNSNETSGTPGYMAPQVLLRQNHSFCVDYFAVGVIAYELALGKRPYIGRERKQIRDQMLARQAKIPTTYTKLSPNGIDFINRMIQRHVKKRLGFNGIDEIINHPWLSMGDMENDFSQQKYHSPIKPLQVSSQGALNQVTEPDQVWRQNILLLKKQETQDLFGSYNYSVTNKSMDETRRKTFSSYDYASTKQDLEKTSSILRTPTLQDNIISARKYRNSARN